MVLGVGIGGDFELCAELAKRALCRPLDVPHPDPYYAQMERDALEAVNRLGIGPQASAAMPPPYRCGLKPTLPILPGLPVAVNVGCHVTRHAQAVL